MKRLTHKKFGFTLAEILIAMTIIGAVFLLSVPSLRNATTDREKHSQLMKIYPIMDHMIGLIALEYIKPENVPFGQRDNVGNDEFSQLLAQRLRIGEDCQNTSVDKDACWKKGTFNGINFNNDSDYYKMQLVDGTSLAIRTYPSCRGNLSFDETNYTEICAVVYVDINALEPPNEWGKDVFAFIYNKQGEFKPASEEAKKIIEKPKETQKQSS